MALKILDAAPGGQAHDILMINHPAFFSSDAVDYRDFADAGALTGDLRGLFGYFLPGWNPFNWRWRQGFDSLPHRHRAGRVAADHSVLLDGSIRVRTRSGDKILGAALQ